MTLHYHDYLKIGPLLDLQKRESEKQSRPAHDEFLFIIMHQVYELWFKQVLIEFESILQNFAQPKVEDHHMRTIVHRLSRVVEIQKLLLQQVNVMETMSPLDFLEFRGMLSTASGFQSHQFRQIEILMGLKRESRLTYNNAPYDSPLKTEQQGHVKQVENRKSMFEAIESWLERTPFLQTSEFDFWNDYQKSVKEHIEADRKTLSTRTDLTPEQKTKMEAQIENTEKSWLSLFDKNLFDKLRAEDHWRLSHKAVVAALFIQIFRDEPVLNLPYRLIELLLDLDENFTQWRYRHALMARRMLGAKVGTGGSSGYAYLLETIEKHKVFDDFFKITTFLLERSKQPRLPEKMKKQLGFSAYG